MGAYLEAEMAAVMRAEKEKLHRVLRGEWKEPTNIFYLGL
ncbi:hypothetical protein CCACVL1_05379 [Corchorus capsularis]|uniref:Uncharacterized protein n=1 Tax=Corchorus capsularis TaxID=210143 RepID=A0A1R3JL61_COCAP|nr:hypothetical protein CCACVL1_05379 [Corchorus capsularis]